MDMERNTSNGNATSTPEFVKMPLWVSVIALLSAVAIIIISILGNSLVFATFVKFRRIMTVYNIFALFLCLTDLCVGFITVPFFIWKTLHPHLKDKHKFEDDTFLRNEVLCMFQTFFDFAPLVLSEATLFLMAVERTIAVFFPRRLHAKIRIWQAVIVCLIVWGIIILTYMIDLIVDSGLDYEVHTNCVLSPEVRRFTFIFSICMIVSCWILYIGVLIDLFCTNKTKDTISPSSERKATIMTVAVLVAFTCSFLPINVANLVGKPDDNVLSESLNAIFMCLLYGNSAVNPFIYNGASEEFRWAFRKLLRMKTDRVPVTFASKTEDLQMTVQK